MIEKPRLMTFLSLFAGIGGFDLGLERAGMKCIGQVEIDTFCQDVLKKHWPNVKLFGDIYNVKGDEFGKVDVICGGVPCQPASTAGKRKGVADNRWLWPEAFRIVRKIKPTWCLFENVCGIISLERGMVFDSLLSELEGYGYEVQTFCIPACAVNAPHKRDRIWIIGHSKDKISSDSDSKYCQEYIGRDQFRHERKKMSFRWSIYESAWEENWITIATRFCRVDDGFPKGMDRTNRLKALGNSVIPQIVEKIGKAIIYATNGREA